MADLNKDICNLWRYTKDSNSELGRFSLMVKEIIADCKILEYEKIKETQKKDKKTDKLESNE